MNKQITGQTQLICLLGSPVAHSISPMMHNTAFDKLGLDYTYLAFDVAKGDLATAVQGLRTLHARGFNLTMPHKTEMCRLCDVLSPVSQITGSVNTVVNDNGILTGYTTDGIGYMRSLSEAGINVIGKHITILGAGGAAASIAVQAAFDGVASISIFNGPGTSYQHMQTIIDKLHAQTSCHLQLFSYDSEAILRQELEKSVLLVNATSVGMAPHFEHCLIPDASYFHKELVVSDIIYEPRETVLLRLARTAGLQTCNGLSMLLYQGAAAFQLWTGKEMPISSVRPLFS